MSVGLYRYDGTIRNRNSKLTLSEPIASQAFYDTHWTKAIHETETKWFKDGAEIHQSQLSDGLAELERLKEWALQNLAGTDLEYMAGRIERLQAIIPNAFDRKDTLLYIF